MGIFGQRQKWPLLFWAPKALVLIGVVGLLVAQYQRERAMQALVVIKWCELEKLELGNNKGGPACQACQIASMDNLQPVLAFYKSHPHYHPVPPR